MEDDGTEKGTRSMNPTSPGQSSLNGVALEKLVRGELQGYEKKKTFAITYGDWCPDFYNDNLKHVVEVMHLGIPGTMADKAIVKVMRLEEVCKNYGLSGTLVLAGQGWQSLSGSVTGVKAEIAAMTHRVAIVFRPDLQSLRAA